MGMNVNLERMIEEFIELVKIDSETRYEKEISQVLQTKFTELGLEVVEDKSQAKTYHASGNLVCNLSATEGYENKDTLFFTAHMDTVVPGQSIKPSIKDGFIVSDGTTILGADDKAGIAVIFEVIKQIKEQNISHGPIQFIITVGEESGLVGAKHIDQSLLKADYGYALDSDGEVGNIIISAPYQAKFKVIIKGQSAHAGVAPEKGVSAINIAAKAISKMKLGRIDEETTANIGAFSGGQQTNIVCDHVDILAEARSLDEKKLMALIDHIETTFESTAKSLGGQAEIETRIMYPGFKYDQTDKVVKLAKKASDSLNLNGDLLSSGGGSDANIFNSYGIPTVNLSVGYEHIHTTKERIHISNLEKLAQFVLSIISHSI